jgi:hypothetical protein
MIIFMIICLICDIETPPKDIEQLYMDEAKTIFTPSASLGLVNSIQSLFGGNFNH